jgi:hypothetical protein
MEWGIAVEIVVGRAPRRPGAAATAGFGRAEARGRVARRRRSRVRRETRILWLRPAARDTGG